MAVKTHVERLCDTKWFCGWFSLALKFLLENKHLYQTVNIQSFYEAKAGEKKYDWSDMAKMVVGFDDATHVNFRVTLPDTLQLVCANRECSQLVHPHNLSLCVLERLGRSTGNAFSVSSRTLNIGYRYFFDTNDNKSAVQQFSVQYQCQTCKGEPLTFMIRRDGLKLQIVGRSRIEPCLIPEGVHSEMEGLLSDAICASQTGNTLAGICLMRIAIERYVRLVAQDKTGRDLEKIFEIYKTTLPEEFPSSCVGLLRIAYDRLSESIHAAQPDEMSFAESLKDITKHFKMLAAFRFAQK